MDRVRLRKEQAILVSLLRLVLGRGSPNKEHTPRRISVMGVIQDYRPIGASRDCSGL